MSSFRRLIARLSAPACFFALLGASQLALLALLVGHLKFVDPDTPAPRGWHGPTIYLLLALACLTILSSIIYIVFSTFASEVAGLAFLSSLWTGALLYSHPSWRTLHEYYCSFSDRNGIARYFDFDLDHEEICLRVNLILVCTLLSWVALCALLALKGVGAWTQARKRR